MISTHKQNISIFVLLALLGGCGGGGGGSSSSNTPGTADPITGNPPPSQNLTTSGEPVLAAATSLVDGTAVGTANPNWPAKGATTTGGNGAPVAGLSCGLPGTSYSYAHLNIYVDGVQQAIPADIGWVSPDAAVPAGSVQYTCTYPVHTDDASGKLRIDTSAGGSYTLGQFFAVWGQPLSSTNVAGVTGKPVSVYVNDNGTLTKYTGDLSQLALTPKRDISIVVGTAPAQIANYAWADPAPLNPTPINLVAGQSIGQPYFPDGSTASGGQGQTIEGLACEPMNTDYHVHTHVTIIRDQQQLKFPSQVGIVRKTDGTYCFYPIHVHDGSGVIHVEAPTYQRMTLGQLFAIWGQPLSATEAADSQGKPVAFYISDGGDLRQYTGDPRNIELLSRRSIIVVIGSGLNPTPSYNWTTYGEPR